MLTMRLSSVIILFCAALTSLSVPVYSQTNGVSLVRNFYQPHGQSGDVPPIKFSGCWGYVAPDGREYAILGTYTGTAIIDITDSANVREVVHISGPSSIWREMRTWGTYAYVVSEGGGGTQIIDLSQLPDTAWRVTSFTYTSGTNNTSRAHTIEIFDGYMYLNGCANWSPGGIVMFNLNNPIAPAFEGVYTQRYIHDSYIRNDTIFGAAIYSGGGVDIIDARVKSSPTVIARITYTGSGTHNTWVTKDRRYVISTDEIGSTQKNLKFWDLAGLPIPPASPSATYTYNPTDIVHNVTVRGNYAYVAWYTAGLVVVNVTNPISPQTVGWYDTYPGTSGSYNGVWAVYPYFPSGKIIVSDMQTGLYIFRFANLAPRRSVQLLSPVEMDTVRVTNSILFRWSSAADKLQDPHYYELVINGPGVNTRSRAEDTTFRLMPLTNFQAGSTYQWYVMTRDEVTAVPSIDTFRFVYLPPPAAPILSNPPNHATDQPVTLNLSWQSSSGASFYRVQVSLDSLFGAIVVDSTLPSTNVTVGPLAGGTKHFWRVRASNTSGTSSYSSTWDFWTVTVPLAPVLISPNNGATGLTETVLLKWHRSASALSYRVQLATDSLFSTLVRDTSGIVDTSYQLSSLPNTTLFYWHVLAQNGVGNSPWSQRWKFTTAYNQSVQYSVNTGWNTLSLPLSVADPRRIVVYPAATSDAFAFLVGQGYVRRDTIENGRGYWLKFDGAQNVSITGIPQVRDTLAVMAGWNLIGTIAVPVEVSTIVQNPPGIVQSPYYEYDGSYVPADTLVPGRAYWVKTNATGDLVLFMEGTSYIISGKRITVDILNDKKQ